MRCIVLASKVRIAKELPGKVRVAPFAGFAAREIRGSGELQKAE